MRVAAVFASVLISLAPMAARAQSPDPVPAPAVPSAPANSLATLHTGLEALAAKYRGAAPAPEPIQVPVLENTPQNVAVAALLADIMRGGAVYRHR